MYINGQNLNKQLNGQSRIYGKTEPTRQLFLAKNYAS